MALEDTINQHIKKAMLAKEEAALRALRAVKSAILLAKTSGPNQSLNEADEMKIIQKLVKQRNDSIAIYKEQNRDDLASTEIEELEVLQKYLPKQLSESEIRIELGKIIEQTGASSPAETGKVMGAASKIFAGKADNKIVAGIVKEMLSG
jgi:uncharacterized protein YqeY